MSDIGSTTAGRAALRPIRFAWPAIDLSQPLGEVAGVVLLTPILLSVAIWNGFPIIFYDTGAYMLQGLGHVFVAERSPIYSGFLAVTGGAVSLWLVAFAQCLISAFVMTEFARAVRPSLSLWAFVGLGATLCIATGLPWYAGQIEPDCFVAVVPLALYLFAFHGPTLGVVRSTLLFVTAVVAIACHNSHVALAGGMVVVLAIMRVAPVAWIEAHALPRPKLVLAVASLITAIATVYAANYAFTKHVFFSRSGAIFLEARLMEDGLIKPILDTDCPNGARYKICPYKDKLPAHADTWLWMEQKSPFHKLGGFRKRAPESALLVAESLKRYPLENAIVAIENTVLQFFWFQTGDGIVPQEWVLNTEFKIAIPQQVSAYDRAYQQEGEIWFLPINLVHVPVAFLTLAALYLMLRDVVRRRDWKAGMLPALVLIALIGNALVCSVFSGPHGRYQSRIMWLPTFVLALAAWPKIEDQLQRRIGSSRA